MSDYSEFLKSPKWQKKRLEIMQRDGFKCAICKNTERMQHVHHISYIEGKKPWEYDNNMLITLCDQCHDWIHTGSKFNVSENNGFLNVYDFLSISPSIMLEAESIGNHEGIWSVVVNSALDSGSFIISPVSLFRISLFAKSDFQNRSTWSVDVNSYPASFKAIRERG